MTSLSTRNLLLLFCSAAVASAAPTLRLSSAAIGPLAIASGANGSTQTVEAYSITGGTLNLSVATTASWLQASAGSATTCKGSYTGNTGKCVPITVTLNTSGLTAGMYTEFVNITDTNAVDSPQNISATVTIGSVPDSMEFYSAPGGTATQTFDTRGVVTTQPSTATGGNWLALSLNGEGSFTFYYPYVVTVTTQSGQGAGDYSGSIVVTGSNFPADNKTIAVTLHVTTSPIAVLSTSHLTLIAGQGSKATHNVNIANGGQGTLTVSGASVAISNGSGWLSAAPASNNASVAITADATALSPGSYSGTVTLATNAANNSQLSIPVSLLVNTSTGPQINIGGVVDNAIAQGSTVAQGDIVAVYGTQFTNGPPVSATTRPLLDTLGETQVLVNGFAAPLYYTSTGQIDAQIPYEARTGLANVQVVNNGVAGNMVSVNIAAREPRILVFGGNVPIIVNTDGSVPWATATALPNHPAKIGDTLVIYAIGLGPTDPAVATGVGAPAAEPLARVDPPSNVMLGGLFTSTVQVTPLYIGLTPYFVGLYQINFTIPQNAPTGNNVPLSLNVQGAASQGVTIAIQ